MHYKELVFSRRHLPRSCCGYKPKTIWMILILPAYLRRRKSRGKAHGCSHISTHEEPAESLLCYRCAMIYHCVVNLQIMEDQMTPARSLVLNVIFLKHFVIFIHVHCPIFFSASMFFCTKHSRLLAVEEDRPRS